MMNVIRKKPKKDGEEGNKKGAGAAGGKDA